MNKGLYIFALMLLLTGLSTAGADARFFGRKKQKTQEPAFERVTPIVSPYDKLILSAKNRTTVHGPFRLHKIGDKVFLEVDHHLFGRGVMLSSYLDRTGDLSMAEPGMPAMQPEMYVFERTDSLVLLKKPVHNVHVTDGDENIAAALALSRAAATVMTFPIECSNLDTTAVVFDATKLLYASNRKLVDMTGRQLSGDFRVTSSKPDTKHGFITSVEGFRSGVAVSFETGLSLEATGMMGFVIMDMESTVAITSYLTLLPDEKMKPRRADRRVGTGYVSFTGFTGSGTHEGHFATRLGLEPGGQPDSDGLSAPVKPVRIYVDTLFSPTWYAAVRDGIEAWSVAFRQAGFRDVFVVEPYPSGEDFNANDPLLNTVRFGQGLGTVVTHQTVPDPRTGEILGFHITVPRDFVQGLRRQALHLMGETDPRYREYFLPQDAVYEGLRAEVMRHTGFSLGLAPNHAGSFAYSPEQICDPEFTRRHGFTASVLDGMPFNFVARPGDRERGVETVISKPGTYDLFAVKWLYSPLGEDEEEILDGWLREVEGDPEYLYVRPQSLRAPYDPRAFPKDLSNDVFVSSDRLLETLKFVMANAHRWIDDDRIPTEYKTLFPDYVILKFDDIILSLCSYIGGIYINETAEGTPLPSYEPVPREVQRRALLKILSLFDDLSWMDSNPRLLNMAGMDKKVSSYVYNNWPVRYLLLRIMGRNGAIALSSAKSDSPYTQAEALADLADYIFQDIRRGREMTDGRMVMLGAYIDQLISATPVMKSNYETNTAPARRTAYRRRISDLTYSPDGDSNYGDQLGNYAAAPAAITSFDYFIAPDNSGLYTEKLRQALRMLIKGRSYCGSQYSRDRYEHYISKIELALRVPD